MKLLLAASCAACTTGSPLARSAPQIDIRCDPAAGTFTLSVTTWNDLEVLYDGITSGEITATLDDRRLVIDPSATGYFGQHDSYAGVFVPPEIEAAISHPASSRISISDGMTTWSGEIANLFANDLAAAGPIAAGETTFVWPSAAFLAGYSSIDWACVDVDGHGSMCGGVEADPQALTVSQQFVTVDLDGAPGTHVAVTAERSADTEDTGDGPGFSARIVNRLDGTLAP
jgi:hypothetical protein